MMADCTCSSHQGSKLWRQAYRFDGKQKTLSLGPDPVVSLADARQKREAANKLLAVGIDRCHQARLDRISTQASNSNTFNAVADDPKCTSTPMHWQ